MSENYPENWQETWSQTWSVADAKARFSEVIDKARHVGPQLITRHGKPAVVMVAASVWGIQPANAAPAPSVPAKLEYKPQHMPLGDRLMRSPLRGSGIDFNGLRRSWELRIPFADD